MFIVSISLFIVTFLSLISRNLSLMQATKEVNPHSLIVPWVNMWSAIFFFFFFFCHLFNVGVCILHIVREGQVEWTTYTSVGDGRTTSNYLQITFVLFHNVTCYTNSIISRYHVNTIKLRNITCTLGCHRCDTTKLRVHQYV